MRIVFSNERVKKPKIRILRNTGSNPRHSQGPTVVAANSRPRELQVQADVRRQNPRPSWTKRIQGYLLEGELGETGYRKESN